MVPCYAAEPVDRVYAGCLSPLTLLGTSPGHGDTLTTLHNGSTHAACAASSMPCGATVFINLLLPDADLLPAQAATVTEGGLEIWPDAGSAFNIGIMLFRQGALPFAQVGAQPALGTWWAVCWTADALTMPSRSGSPAVGVSWRCSCVNMPEPGCSWPQHDGPS